MTSSKTISMFFLLLVLATFLVSSTPASKFLLVETEGGDTKSSPKKRIDPRHPAHWGRTHKGVPLPATRRSGKKGQDFNLIVDLLDDPNLVKSLIPKNTDEFFAIAEEIVPGMMDLQKPVEDTWLLLQRVLLDLPEVAEKLTPTLIEIRKDVQGDKKISDKQFTKWGKSLVQKGRPFAKKALDNFVAAPIEEIANKLGASSVISKVNEFLDKDYGKLVNEAVAWLEQMYNIGQKIKKS